MQTPSSPAYMSTAKRKIILAIKSSLMEDTAKPSCCGKNALSFRSTDVETMTIKGINSKKLSTVPCPPPTTEEQQKLHFPGDRYLATCYSEVFKKQYLLGQFYFQMSRTALPLSPLFHERLAAI